MHDFLLAFLGGSLLGIAVTGYLYVNGRIAGISGLIGQVMNPQTIFKTPALWFLAGLFTVPFIYGAVLKPEIVLTASPLMMIIAGLLVGFGTRLGSGCTSGHGICGMSRLSVRSIVATLTFMFAGFVAVYIVRHITGAF
ncbi:YeeE/YedE thiosulfate transporter family protein [Acinetobacter chinensis]|uniref:YeeE/YedE thiosulfate transporter family protein n=1 Tax=Acinetobacter chinensis TaxID=2004650 RepID=A0ABU3WDH0_9GAMM|nr:YeeE/YedE thiosulfate transporter family protein [Acinetobacter chinensis]MDV2468438.1 YeeE/YedE thiosulfate transporter family protein [Acinetobacter chinensis]